MYILMKLMPQISTHWEDYYRVFTCCHVWVKVIKLDTHSYLEIFSPAILFIYLFLSTCKSAWIYKCAWFYVTCKQRNYNKNMTSWKTAVGGTLEQHVNRPDRTKTLGKVRSRSTFILAVDYKLHRLCLWISGTFGNLSF